MWNATQTSLWREQYKLSSFGCSVNKAFSYFLVSFPLQMSIQFYSTGKNQTALIFVFHLVISLLMLIHMWIREVILFLKANMLAESKPEVRPDKIYTTHI